MENVRNFFKKKNIDFFFPIAFILSIVPLIVRGFYFDNPDESTVSIVGVKLASSDLFSQWKSFILMIFCIILIVISVVFFKKIFNKKDKILNSIVIAGAIFFIFTLLSAIFSNYSHVAMWGIYDRAEGLITIACYIILFIYSIYTFKSTKDFKYVLVPIYILVSINAFLGLFQYIGQDLLKTNLGAIIAIPSEHINPNGPSVDLTYAAGRLYGTLFHYDYVGSFVAIVLPILFCLTLFEDIEIMHKLNLGLFSLLSIWLLFGSTSRAGIIGVIAAAVFGIVIYWKLVVKKWKPLLIIVASLIVIIVGINFATKGAIFNRIPTLINDATSLFKDTSDFDYRDHTFIKDLKYSDKSTDVILQNDTLKISYENNDYVFRNSKNEVINFTKTNGSGNIKGSKIFTTTNETFKDIKLMCGPLTPGSTRNDAIRLDVGAEPIFMFRLKDDNSIHLYNINSKKDIDIEYPPTIGFKGKEKIGSARGYIWSRTLPLLKDNILLGSGPDTFLFRFPNNDIIGRYYTYGNTTVLVDKPHNMYLQIAVNNGVVALLAFLAIIIIYIIDSIKLYSFKQDYDKSKILGSATCLGVIGYLFAGIFNDSVVSVAPIFWIILGVGVALNYINRTELNKHK